MPPSLGGTNALPMPGRLDGPGTMPFSLGDIPFNAAAVREPGGIWREVAAGLTPPALVPRVDKIGDVMGVPWAPERSTYRSCMTAELSELCLDVFAPGRVVVFGLLRDRDIGDTGRLDTKPPL